MEGPTKRLDLGPELSGVPVVVATLTRKSVQLSEFEAWIVSLIDGLSDSKALAKTAGVRELELRVVLRTLNEKHIIDFADEPLSDADLEMPSVMGTLDEEAELQTAPGFLDPPPEPPPARVVHGATADRRDGRFVAPSSRAAVVPPPLPDVLPPAPPRAPSRVAPSFLEREHAPIVQGKVEPPVLTPAGGRTSAPRRTPTYPGMTAEQKAGLPPSRAVGLSPNRPPSAALPPAPPAPSPPPPPRPPERTDPRIAYTGPVNRKVLDALKKVKRVDAGASSTPSAPPKEEREQTLADVLARDTLQVALRMEQGGRLDEAIRFLEKSIAQSPDAASLYNRLGIILMRERADYRRAETLIRKAIDLAPDNTVYSTNLRQVLSKHAMKGQR